MSMVSVTPTFVSNDWMTTERGKRIFAALSSRDQQRRRAFALLEHPVFAPSDTMEEFEYKIFISGKSGVGKTSMAAKLSANTVPVSHSETAGICTYTLYWPALIVDTEQVVMFKLVLWDAGENTLKKFDHILPACKDKVDGVIFSFSFADKASFEDLGQQISRVTAADDNFCRFVVGTKLDVAASEVTSRAVGEFEAAWRLPVLGIRNTSDSHVTLADEMKHIAPLLNYICDELWKRDQILAGTLAVQER